jgi:hypothetical protein
MNISEEAVGCSYINGEIRDGRPELLLIMPCSEPSTYETRDRRPELLLIMPCSEPSTSETRDRRPELLLIMPCSEPSTSETRALVRLTTASTSAPFSHRQSYLVTLCCL